MKIGCLAAAAFGAALLWPHAAFAGDAALAEALFQEAKKLADAGNFAEACPKFEASYRAERTLGTLLNLANCHEQTGRVASAWAEWNEAIELARSSGDERVTFATERRDKLSSRLPKLELRVRGSASGLSVHRDDVRLPSGAYGTAVPVDPGAHEISVRRGDTILERRSVTLTEGKTEVVELDLAAIERAHPAPAAPTGPESAAVRESPRADAPPQGSGQKTLGFVIGGVGVAALLTAGVFEVIAITNKNNADEPDQCVNKYCSPQGLESADRAKTFAEIGQWVGIGGVVLTAVGLTLVLTSPESPRTTARLDVSPFIGTHSGGLSVKGSL